MKRILIIEDQADIRRLIRWTLQFEDHLILEAGNVPAGLQVALSTRPDLVLVDSAIGGDMNGLGVCRQIKGDPQLARTRILLLVAATHARSHETARQAGVDATLGRPFSPLQLVESVTELLREERQGDAAETETVR